MKFLLALTKETIYTMLLATKFGQHDNVSCTVPSWLCNLLCGFLTSYIAHFQELALPKRHHFVLVHGIGGGAWFFHEIVTYLEAANFLVTTMDLTSNGIDKTAVADDVTTVAEYTKPLIETLRSSNGQVRSLKFYTGFQTSLMSQSISCLTGYSTRRLKGLSSVGIELVLKQFFCLSEVSLLLSIDDFCVVLKTI